MNRPTPRQTERRTATPSVRAAVVGIVGLFVLVAGAHADRITLRPEARVPNDRVTLADVADLEGNSVEPLADLQVAEFQSGAHRVQITRRAIRKLLSDQGVNWGLVSLRGHVQVHVHRHGAAGRADRPEPGRTSRVATPEPDAAVADPPATDATAKANPLPHTISVSAEAGPPVDDQAAARSLETLVAQWIIARTGVAADRLRIDWRDTDAAVRNLTTAQGRLELDPHSTDPLGRLPMTVRKYEADRLVASHRLTLEVEAMLPAVIARDAIARGQTLTREDLVLRTESIDSMRHAPLADVEQAIGKVAARSIRRGQIVEADDVRDPDLVQRGQLVTVRALSGELVLKTVARAMEPGQRDQVIQVRHPRSREIMHVRVSGPQEAVMLVGASRGDDSNDPGDDS